MAFERSRQILESFKREITVYRRVLGLAIAYVCMPFDLIPDFIPVIGHLDDAIIVPALVIMALRSVPADVISEHRRSVNCEEAESRKKNESITS